MAPVTATQPHCYSSEAATDNMQMSGLGCEPVRLKNLNVFFFPKGKKMSSESHRLIISQMAPVIVPKDLF